MNYISIGIIIATAFLISVTITKFEIPVLKQDRTSERMVLSLICQRQGHRAWEV